jgi:hypothetical protein
VLAASASETKGDRLGSPTDATTRPSADAAIRLRPRRNDAPRTFNDWKDLPDLWNERHGDRPVKAAEVGAPVRAPTAALVATLPSH